MKSRSFLTVLIVVFVGVALADSAEAGWFDKMKNKKETTKTHRFSHYPTMNFYSGVLRRDTFEGWKLDDTLVEFKAGAPITGPEAQKVSLREGMKILVMGTMEEGVIVAWRGRVMANDWNISRNDSRDHEITWSTSDPTLGEGPTKE